MDENRRPPAKECLYDVKEDMRRASTRQGLYARMSLETGRSEPSIRMAVSRAGLTKGGLSLHHIFSSEEEEALVAACIIFARQGVPYTIRDFIELASSFAEKKNVRNFLAVLSAVLLRGIVPISSLNLAS